MKDVLLVVFDFDGVMTDNRVQVHQSGEEAVWCHRGDGWGIARLKEAGFEVIVLSTESNPVVGARCRKLKIDAIQGCHDKSAILQQLVRGRNLRPEQVAYVGNDLNDVTCMHLVGWPIAVADAGPEVRALAKWVTRLPGGRGAVREVADRLLLCRRDNDPTVEWARESLWRSIEIKQAMASSNELLSQIVRVARTMTEVLKAGGRIFCFGNRGSAAEAQQLAAELVGRFVLERRPLSAIALTVNSSPMPSIRTDNASDLIFARQLETQARAGDMAVGITMNGNSPDVVRGLEKAREIGLRTVALTGTRGQDIRTVVEECICVPSDNARLIQEAHIFLGRMLSEYVERALFDARPVDR
jgi:YrbI family 3-deoxy-D-manno-octulosonate 8-phosphate phosphatase